MPKHQYTTKASPRLVQKIQHKNENKKIREPIAIVYPEAVSPGALEQIAKQSLLNGTTVILPTQVELPQSKGRAKAAKLPELPWQTTPAALDISKLVNHYLMLSKIRLTSKSPANRFNVLEMAPLTHSDLF